MPNPNESTEKTEQNLYNLSYDEALEILTMEMIGTNNNTATRVAVTSDGLLKVTT